MSDLLAASMTAHDPLRSWPRVAVRQSMVDTDPSVRHSIFRVDTTCRLQPYGFGERIAAFHRPLHPNDGSATQALMPPLSFEQRMQDMRDFRHAKAMAHTLRASLAAKGFKITASQSLELIAEAFGVADWNTLSATIRAGTADARNSAAPPQFSTALSVGLKSSLLRAIAYANRRKHQYATLEHLLLALIDDREASAVMTACKVDLGRLREHLVNYIDDELTALITDEGEPRPTAAFQRVIQRAAIVQSSEREEATGANVLVAIFVERESYAVYSLMEQGMTRYDAINYISGGLEKGDGDTAA
jgi:hypothetical protein